MWASTKHSTWNGMEQHRIPEWSGIDKTHPATGRDTFHCPRGLQGLSSLGSAPGPYTGTRALVKRGAAAPPQPASPPGDQSCLALTEAGSISTSREGEGQLMTGGAAPAPAGTLWGARHQGQGDPGRSRCSGLVPQLLVLKLQGRALLPALPCSSCLTRSHLVCPA